MEELEKTNGNSAMNSLGKENDNSFSVLLRFLRRFMVLIILFTVLGTLGGLGLAYKKDHTVYTQTKAVVVVASIDGKTQATNISLTDKLKNSIAGEITAPTIINRAKEIYEEPYLAAGKRPHGTVSAGAISVETGDNLILDISYSASNAEDAAEKLDAFLEAVEEKISSLFTSYASQISLTRLDNAPKYSSSNGFVKYMLLGVIGGLALGLLIAFVTYILDNTVRSKSELENITDAAVIAYIDDVTQE